MFFFFSQGTASPEPPVVCVWGVRGGAKPPAPIYRFPTHFPFPYPFPVFSPISRLPTIHLYAIIQPSLPTGQANRAGTALVHSSVEEYSSVVGCGNKI